MSAGVLEGAVGRQKLVICSIFVLGLCYLLGLGWLRGKEMAMKECLREGDVTQGVNEMFCLLRAQNNEVGMGTHQYIARKEG